jgi:AbiV family abortive infection protein
VSVLIPWKKTLEGAKLAVDNAERIAYDADSLSRAGRYQTAFSLSLLAWEETNKAGLLIRAYIERQGITHNEWQNKFRNHPYKLMAYPEYTNVLYGEAKKPEPQETVTKVKEMGKILDLEKQLLGFYVDWDQTKSKWRSPNTLSAETISMYVKIWGEYYSSNSILTCLALRERIQEIENGTPLHK